MKQTRVGALLVVERGHLVGIFTERDLLTRVVAQGLARFKAPDRVVVVDVLPLLPAGKPDKAAIERLVRDA